MITPSNAKTDFIEVDGVRLQMLDWGGSGPALVFLAGYANTPHFFDPLACAFTDRFRVVGLTRRAHGASDQPETGYDVPTLAEDVVGLLDVLGFESASFVGHSFAGHELCCLAIDHPRRVKKLVFLDTLYDYTDEDRLLLATNPLPPSDPPPETFESVAAYCKDFVARYPSYRRLRSPRWDALWAHSLERTADGRYRERIRPETSTKLFEGVSAFRPDYTAIRCAVLAFFAFQDEDWSLPEDASDELQRAMKRYIEQVNTRVKRRCIERVRREIAGVRIVELADTSHYCFLDRQADVMAAMRDFL
jgi:pimeloyl-ACP methyl ester carboxylesterase